MVSIPENLLLFPKSDQISKEEKSSVFNKSCLKNQIQNYIPCSKWLPKYNLKLLQCDFIAGLAVGLTVIPQALAYAQIAGLPIQYGLYSSFMGSFVYAIFGTSKDITLGPTAIMSLLVHTYGGHDPIQAVLLTLLGGCIQTGMGLFRLGFIMRYISAPVVSGFTSAAAFTIGLGQLKHIFGVKTTSSTFFPALFETLKQIGNLNPWDLVMGLTCIIVLMLLKFMGIKNSKTINECINENTKKIVKLSRNFIWLICLSRNAIVVISAGFIGYAIHSIDDENCKHIDCLTLTGNITKGIPSFKAPDLHEEIGNITLNGKDFIKKIGSGLLIVPLMGILESLAIGKAFARKNKYEIDVNQEMIAIGFSNIMSCFVSSFSITGSFSRTAINSQSGVKTPAGGIITGCIVLFSLALLTPLIYYIPKSALAAVIISAVVFMIDFETPKLLWKTNKIDLLPWAATFFVCFYQIPIGILAGVGVSLVIVLYPLTFPPITYNFYTIPILQENSENSENYSVMVVSCPNVLYTSSESLQNIIKNNLPNNHVKTVALDLSKFAKWDYTGLITLTELAETLKNQEIYLSIISESEKFKFALSVLKTNSSIMFFDSVNNLLKEVN